MKLDKPLKWTLALGYLGIVSAILILLTAVSLPLSMLPEDNPVMLALGYGMILSILLSLLLVFSILICFLEIAVSKKDGFSKGLWIVGLLFLPPITPVLYYFWGRRNAEQR